MAHDDARRLAHRPAKAEERTLVAADGTRLFMRSWEGPRDRAALVLCDGLGCDGFVWRYIVDRFAGERPVVHVHYRGHGKSEVPRDLSSVKLATLIDDIGHALDDAGVDAAVWCGHSMGVQVALEGYRRAQRRVRGMALLCGSFEKPIDTWHHGFFEGETAPFANRFMRRIFTGLTGTMIQRWEHIGPVWKALVSSERAFRATVQNELNPELIIDDDFRPYMRHLANMDMRVFATLARDLSVHSARDLLPHVNVPTLVVGGGRDRFAPLWVSEEMHRLIPGSDILRLVQGSHTAPIEEPRIVERALAKLLERVDAHR